MSRAWSLVALGEVLTHRKEFIQINDLDIYKRCRVQLHAQGIVLRDAVAGAEIKTKKQQVCKSGDFLVAEIDAKVGGFGIVPKELDSAIVSSHYFLFGIDESRLDRRFLDYYVRTPGFRDQVTAQGSTNYAAIRPRDVLGYTIPLPPLADQRRIVTRIEELAAKIDEARGLRRQAVEEAAAVYQSFLASVMASNHSDWIRETIGDVLLSMDAGWSPQCDERPANADEWGVLKTTSVQWCEFRPFENKLLPGSLSPRPELCVDAGDVLVTRAGPRKRVGVVAAVRNDAHNLMISDKLIRLRPDQSKVQPRFLELAIASPFSQEHLVNRKTGLADAQVNISQAILRTTPISYPSLAEQHRIIAYLENLQTKVDTLKRIQSDTAAELDAMLPSILEKAFQGGFA